MANKIDPSLTQLHAENVRAQLLTPGGFRLDAQIIGKIARGVPVFAGMTLECLMSTLACAENYPVRAGEAVFNEGDIGSAFYVLIAGEVVVQKQRNAEAVTLATLGPGECFGEMALVRNDVRSATVRATVNSVTMRFDRERVDENLQSAHMIYRNIARTLAARLDVSSIMLVDLVVQHKSSALPQ
jgi:signal-transduction protein with cAMP-binding, CBS, and nucleotidyltransferase domain